MPGAQLGSATSSASRDVLITFPDFDVDGESGAALRAAGLGIRLAPRRRERAPREVTELLGDAVAAIVSTDPFDAEVLDAATRLRVIARLGVGVDSIDLDAATRRGVAVTITPGANETTVADHTVALMLAALRRVCELDGQIRGGAWNRTGEHTPWLLSGTSVGLVGYGRIGRLVADRLEGFGVRLLACDPQAQPDGRVELVALDELLAVADVVSLHMPLLPSTRHLIDARALRTMRPEAILVNTARGDVVDEEALTQALLDGRLRGAALDVFAQEPPAAGTLLALPNVVLSPHNGGLSVQSLDEMSARATAAVLDVLGGRAPEHLANPAVLESARFGGEAVAGA